MIWHPIQAAVWILELVAGILSLLVLLSIAATIPGLNLIALGYVLYAEGEVARSGKLRNALPLVPAAARLGSIIAGVCLWLWPIWYLADVARDVQLIAPASAAARWYGVGLIAAATVVAAHLLLAVACDGRIDRFLWPIGNILWLRRHVRQGGFWESAERSIRNFLDDMRLPRLAWLGACGFVGTGLWLLVPSLLFALPSDPAVAWQRWLAVIGGAGLIIVLGWAPLFQAHFAAQGYFRALFELRNVRALFRQAPLRWVLAVSLLYASAILMFLWSGRLKMLIQSHREILDLTVISLATTFPARILLGWVYSRAAARGPAPSTWVWIMRLLLVVLLAGYVYLLFLSSLTAELGRHWFNEHHALLLPIPW
ncbi:MAG: hypothetical protein HY290_16475 [Planctomycetia bacterium]|nr:hypothetical protein [Planctomycetia bacterium]